MKRMNFYWKTKERDPFFRQRNFKLSLRLLFGSFADKLPQKQLTFCFVCFFGGGRDRMLIPARSIVFAHCLHSISRDRKELDFCQQYCTLTSIVIIAIESLSHSNNAYTINGECVNHMLWIWKSVNSVGGLQRTYVYSKHRHWSLYTAVQFTCLNISSDSNFKVFSCGWCTK